jgi:hypothetical protein
MRPATVCGGAGADSSTGEGTDGDADVEVALPDVAAAVGAALEGRSPSAVARATRLLAHRAAAAEAMATSHRRRRRGEAGARSGCRTHARIGGRGCVQASSAAVRFRTLDPAVSGPRPSGQPFA